MLPLTAPLLVGYAEPLARSDSANREREHAHKLAASLGKCGWVSLAAALTRASACGGSLDSALGNVSAHPDTGGCCGHRNVRNDDWQRTTPTAALRASVLGAAWSLVKNAPSRVPPHTRDSNVHFNIL